MPESKPAIRYLIPYLKTQKRCQPFLYATVFLHTSLYSFIQRYPVFFFIIVFLELDLYENPLERLLLRTIYIFLPSFRNAGQPI